MVNLDFVRGGPLLFIGCHPDDVEYGCGGIISKLKNKIPIYVLTLSKNQKNPKVTTTATATAMKMFILLMNYKIIPNQNRPG